MGGATSVVKSAAGARATAGVTSATLTTGIEGFMIEGATSAVTSAAWAGTTTGARSAISTAGAGGIGTEGVTSAATPAASAGTSTGAMSTALVAAVVATINSSREALAPLIVHWDWRRVRRAGLVKERSLPGGGVT